MSCNCPKCGHDKIDRRASIFSIKNKHTCTKCGHTWKE